jgi:hypothetical protein
VVNCVSFFFLRHLERCLRFFFAVQNNFKYSNLAAWPYSSSLIRLPVWSSFEGEPLGGESLPCQLIVYVIALLVFNTRKKLLGSNTMGSVTFRGILIDSISDGK